MGLRDLVYGAYERRLAARAAGRDALPRHVGVILDGNRRWARADGARRRARATRPAPTRSQRLLGWCDEVGVEVVTLWLLSTDNLNRPADELARC